MSGRIVGPSEITVEDLVRAAATRVGMIGAHNALESIADVTGTNPEGVAHALTLWRSNLCGAADVLPHVEAERDQLRAKVERLRGVIQDIVGHFEDVMSNSVRESGGASGYATLRELVTWCREAVRHD